MTVCKEDVICKAGNIGSSFPQLPDVCSSNTFSQYKCVYCYISLLYTSGNTLLFALLRYHVVFVAVS